MKRFLLPALLLMTALLAACGGGTPQTTTEADQPTQAESQPTLPQPLPTDTSAPVVESTPSEAPTEAATEAAVTDGSGGVSYANDVYPIFEASCIKCHGVEATKEGLDMLTYENLMAGSHNGAVVVPGNANESVLIDLIIRGKMPNRGPDLSAEQIQIITDWVNQGALNN